jgi:hypothetical protein
LDRRLPAGSPMIAAVAAVRNIRCSFRGPQLLAGRLRLLVRSLLAERVFYLTPTDINRKNFSSAVRFSVGQLDYTKGFIVVVKEQGILFIRATCFLLTLYRFP